MFGASFNLISLALRGMSVDVSKVISMIEEMVGVLEAELVEDDDKKVYCVQSFNKTEDLAKAWAHQIMATRIRVRITWNSCFHR